MFNLYNFVLRSEGGEDPENGTDKKDADNNVNGNNNNNNRSRMSRIRSMIFLSVAYAANTGGTGSLTGTGNMSTLSFMISIFHQYFSGSNLVFKGFLSEYKGNPINFASWMQYATLPMLINLFICWGWLQLWYIGLPKSLKGCGILEKLKTICSSRSRSNNAEGASNAEDNR